MRDSYLMPPDKIQYVIFVDQEDEKSVMLTAPLEEGDREYFVKGIIPTLLPLSDEDYMQGPAVILHTATRFSYIVYGNDVYWCVEWEPGLIVVRFSPDETIAWSALRSPIPNFGGRTPSAEDVRNFKEDFENHQYNLVFNAWDAQFEEDVRQWQSFQRADSKTVKVYQAVLAHGVSLGEKIQARYSEGDKFEPWVEQCKRNLREWSGEGIRVGW